MLTTIGLDYSHIIYRLSDGTIFNTTIIDCGGEDRYRAILIPYYRKVDGCLLVYDITDRKSFDKCKEFYKKD